MALAKLLSNWEFLKTHNLPDLSMVWVSLSICISISLVDAVILTGLITLK